MKLFALTDLAPLMALNFWSGEGVTGVTECISYAMSRYGDVFSLKYANQWDAGPPGHPTSRGLCWNTVEGRSLYRLLKPRNQRSLLLPFLPLHSTVEEPKWLPMEETLFPSVGPWISENSWTRHWIKKILCLWGQPASRAKTELQMESVAFVTRCLLTVWRNPHCKLQIFSKEILLLPSCTSCLHCYSFLLLYAHMVELWSVWGKMYGSINCQCRCSFWVACLLKFNYQLFHHLYILSLHLFAHSERV